MAIVFYTKAMFSLGTLLYKSQNFAGKLKRNTNNGFFLQNIRMTFLVWRVMLNLFQYKLELTSLELTRYREQ